jgi:hypothetical protein
MSRPHTLPPEPLLARTARPLRIALGILLVAAIVATVVLRQRWIPGGTAGEEVAAAQCRAGYQRARTATDSAVVDAQRPIISREQATVARTCRELRLAAAARR